MKSLAATLAIIISIFGYIPYVKDSISGKTKPHIISWFTWALISFLAFGIQFFEKGGAGSFVNFFMGLVCLTIFFIGIRNGTKNISKIDIAAFVLALAAILLWVFVKQPLVSIFLVAFIDLMSFIPTIRKSWGNPWSETLVMWEIAAVKNLLTIYALQSMTLVTVLYPAYSLTTNLLFSVLLMYRRVGGGKQKEIKTQSAVS